MNRWEEERKTLREPFNIDRHKNTFINYLEVVILKDGTIEYAVPSHMEKAISIYSNMSGKTRDEIKGEFFIRSDDFILKETGIVMLWTHTFQGNPNKTQKEKMKELKSHGLYLGAIPV